MPDEPITNLTPPEPTSVSAEATATVVAPAEMPPISSPIETTTPPVIPAPEPTPATDSPISSLLAKALAKIQFRKQAKLEKIMVLAKQRGQITNDDAQKLLRVSDATASRYLAELVKNGRLQMVGHPRNASYKPAT